MKLTTLLGVLLYPEKCVLCGRLLRRGETDLCRQCRIDQPLCGGSGRKYPYLDSWTALWEYRGPVRTSLHRYKFGGRRSYAESYARMLAMQLLNRSVQADVMTWVPISEKRRRSRGFDQSELLARKLEPLLGIPTAQLLWKRRDTPRQSRISGSAQRRANVLGAYEAIEVELLRGKRVLLLDDILTTGATAGECARILLSAGATEVHFAAVAAVNRKNQNRKV